MRDIRARVAVARRIEHVAAGSLGHAKPLGGAISELRVDVGAGYRLYFTVRQQVEVIFAVRRDQAYATSRHQACPRTGERGVNMGAKTKTRLLAFDMSTVLDSPEAIAEYLSQVLADGEPDELLRALGHVAKARGMAQIAKDTGLGRESLYKALAPGAKPRYDTVLKVTRALGVELSARPAA